MYGQVVKVLGFVVHQLAALVLAMVVALVLILSLSNSSWMT